MSCRKDNLVGFFNPHEDMLIDCGARGRGRGRRGKREEKGRGRWRGERNTYPLPPIRALTGDQTQNLSMCPDGETELATIWCTGRCSNQLSHSARAQHSSFIAPKGINQFL